LCRAALALRIRVSMSAIGSVEFIVLVSSPRRRFAPRSCAGGAYR
jgi:hypothetical protein